MRTELANWTARQSKHAAVAYPLITYLICMEENNTFGQYVDTLVDNLHRQLKVDTCMYCLYMPVLQHAHDAVKVLCSCVKICSSCKRRDCICMSMPHYQVSGCLAQVSGCLGLQDMR